MNGDTLCRHLRLVEQPSATCAKHCRTQCYTGRPQGGTEVTMTDIETERYREFRVPLPVDPGQTNCDPVGALEIAERLGLEPRTVHMIRRRGQLPPPDFAEVNGSRAWSWRTILWWAGETDRLRSDALLAEYRATFATAPLERPFAKAPPGSLRRVDDHPGTPAVPSRLPIPADAQ